MIGTIKTSFLVLLLIVAAALPAQEFLTASRFFDSVSERYGEVTDYTATVRITRDNSVSTGELWYQSPNRVRIDFSEPTGQVLVSDGEMLQVYIPQFNVVLEQPLRRRTDESLASLASERGLNLLSQNYSIAYLDSPTPVPLDEGSEELVTRVRLDWRNNNEGYRQLIISISEDLLIRRIVGVTASYEEITFDFQNLVVNTGIPESRFDYEAPSSANLFTNFLFEGEG